MCFDIMKNRGQKKMLEDIHFIVNFCDSISQGHCTCTFKSCVSLALNTSPISNSVVN